MPGYENIFIRTSPSLHDAMRARAATLHTSMNQVVIAVLEGMEAPFVGCALPDKGAELRDVILRVPPALKARLREQANGGSLTSVIHALLLGTPP